MEKAGGMFQNSWPSPEIKREIKKSGSFKL